MAKDVAIRIQFVYDRTSHVLSEKDYRLQEAEALSHAAKISHERRRQRKESPSSKATSSPSSRNATTNPSGTPNSVISFSDVHYLDPLYNVPHPKVGSFYRAIDIWFQWILPNAAPAFVLFNVCNIFESYFSSPGCQSEAAQHCIAALAYGCLELHRKETNSWEFDYSREQLKHNALAISLLKKDIASKRTAADSPSAINTIFLLSFLAQFRGDHQESALHRKALRRLFDYTAGPVDRAEFDRRYGGLLLQFSCWMDVLEGRPNVLEILPERQNPRMLISAFNCSTASKNYDVAASLPDGFQKLVSKGALSEETRRLLARFAHACQFGLNTVPKPEGQFPDYAVASPWLTVAEPSLEKCLLLALLCYAHMRWSIAPNYVAGILCHTISRTKLAQALPWVPATDDPAIIACLVWMWMVLVDSYRLEGSVLPRDGLSCLGEFKFHFPDWQSWTDIEIDVLPKFFWRDGDSVAIREAWGS